ncbi:MAG: VWA domain-containing protein [Planctomycetota bacterium]|nr:VWA domain-containing protein [Planctomycetota bacterium]
MKRKYSLAGDLLALAMLAGSVLLLARGAFAETILVPVNWKPTPVPVPVPQPQPEPPIIIDPPRPRPPRPIPPPPPPNFRGLPFHIAETRVEVRIEENVATTTFEQAVRNDSGQVLEVQLMIPLPPGAMINKAALSMGDSMIEGRVLDEAQARSIYESYVRRMRDPLLLRMAGNNVYEARIFPFNPGETRTFRFAYDEVLPPASGLYQYRHVLAGTQMYKDGADKFSLNVIVRSRQAMGSVYSPSHAVKIERPDEKTAVVKFTAEKFKSDRDFQLFFAPSKEDVTLRMLCHRSGDEDGYFLLLGRPDDRADKAKPLPKDIVFVLDTSGSMAGDKMEQAKSGFKFCIRQLNPNDRFNLIPFSTDVRPISPNLLPAARENVEKAVKAVEELEATGGTNIAEAITTALANDFSTDPGRARLIIFMTDGLPTTGITDMSQILKDVRITNTKKVRIFAFGVGHDVNTHLLDRMSGEWDGTTAYIAPKEDIEVKVSDFYAKIKNPVMTDIEFDFGGAQVHSLYPKKVPALFKGSEVLMFGRYKGPWKGEVIVRGMIGGERREFRIPADFKAHEGANDFLPRVWAMRKIGHLLEEIRLSGRNQELVAEVVELSRRHGIVTEFTSFLVEEPRAAPVFGMEQGIDDRSRRMAGERLAAADAAQKGENAVAKASLEKELKDAAAPPAASFGAGGGAAGRYRGADGKAAETRELERLAAETVRHVGKRTFYLKGGIWCDSGIKAGMQPKTVKNFSDEYFEILKKHSDLGAVLALGGKIIVVIDGVAYQFED